MDELERLEALEVLVLDELELLLLVDELERLDVLDEESEELLLELLRSSHEEIVSRPSAVLAPLKKFWLAGCVVLNLRMAGTPSMPPRASVRIASHMMSSAISTSTATAEPASVLSCSEVRVPSAFSR